MGFWKKLLVGVKVGLAAASATQGKKFGDKVINVKELPDVVDLEAAVEAAVRAELAKQKDGSH